MTYVSSVLMLCYPVSNTNQFKLHVESSFVSGLILKPIHKKYLSFCVNNNLRPLAAWSEITNKDVVTVMITVIFPEHLT